MKKAVWHSIIILFLGISMLQTNQTYAQCAVCRTSLESLDGEESKVKEGVNSGILYLMGIPYLILAGSLWLGIRYYKAQKEEDKHSN